MCDKATEMEKVASVLVLFFSPALLIFGQCTRNNVKKNCTFLTGRLPLVRDGKSGKRGRACAIFSPSCANFGAVYAQNIFLANIQIYSYEKTMQTNIRIKNGINMIQTNICSEKYPNICHTMMQSYCSHTNIPDVFHNM